MTRLVLFLAATVAFSAPALAGGVVVPAEQRYMSFSGNIVACDDKGVLNYIASTFGMKEEQFWSVITTPSLTISSIENVKEIGFRTNGVAYIPRRYCLGDATMSDHHVRQVVYQLQEWMGFSGYGDGVEWCVVGLDRNLAYAPACSVLEPLVERYAHENVRTHF